MTIHRLFNSLIHTDSSAVTAWFNRNGVRLLLLALAGALLVISSNVLRDVNQSERQSNLDALIHQGKTSR